MNQGQTCEYEECSCEVDSASAIAQDGKQYCSQRCADGRGCDHLDCNCGAFAGEVIGGEFNPAV